jgi:hypothetical protein
MRERALPVFKICTIRKGKKKSSFGLQWGQLVRYMLMICDGLPLGTEIWLADFTDPKAWLNAKGPRGLSCSTTHKTDEKNGSVKIVAFSSYSALK